MFEVLKPTIDAQLVSVGQLQLVKGKTVRDFEFGCIETPKNSEQAEMVIFHFTDGSSLSITTFTNASDLAEKVAGLKPKELHTALFAQHHKSGDDSWRPKPSTLR